jgi:hypothetical protein
LSTFIRRFSDQNKKGENVSIKEKREIFAYFVSTYPGEFKELFALRALFFLSHTSSFTDCLTSLSKGLLSPIAINPLFSNHFFVKFPQVLPCPTQFSPKRVPATVLNFRATKMLDSLTLATAASTAIG